MSAGYSGTPLYKKLGLEEDMRLGLDNPPPEFVGLTLLPVPAGVQFATRIAGNMDMVIGFYDRKRDLEKRLPVMIRRIPQDGVIWICWPKKASRVPTDITEDTVREVAVPHDLVDVKVCAIDQVWSGLKLVIRKEARVE
ncbi:DUF3052 family protein [Euzebya tangerina]|uniref:DUF3052 family protein n=1 Tax=Euzebya tangerina TaxID=591198 RepID=UPI000E310AFE|nr:DUF3052 family protein [Euzebya tangerina]